MTKEIINQGKELETVESKFNKTKEIIEKIYGKDIEVKLIEIDWKKLITMWYVNNWRIEQFWSLDWYDIATRWNWIDIYFLVLKQLWINEEVFKELTKTDIKKLYHTYLKMSYFYDRLDISGSISPKSKRHYNHENIRDYSLINSPFMTMFDFALIKSLWRFDKDSFKDDNDREEVLKKKKAELKYWIKNWVDDVDLFIMPKFLPDYAIADKKQARDIVTKHGQLLTNKKIITKENIDFILKQWLITENEANEYNKLIEERDNTKNTQKKLSSLKDNISMS